ncbi:hypothetical protein I6A60_24720 [Frankia sp. AgB1.9]|uniref:hypothetical protein n=1 Tax=unclassified Frankia TaxID=2632575 RepID=UPI001931F2AB|nr:MULTISPECIES: hypothetical protein [unclassified Frankia]MBL7487438.1 hypothetical protein [Frankia sp. AgW1.1]MBL7551044.1 hypothetical protein [Frankia sp. AgB1.9]MBL7618825.1 hypothetical protein [Frankia sp. AgB1.8]
MSRLGLCLTLFCLWLACLPQRLGNRLTRLDHAARVRRGDRGDGPLTAAVIAAGMVVIAVIVIAIIRAKATDITNHICTQTDQTTCP